jgi:hypothetical protein
MSFEYKLLPYIREKINNPFSLKFTRQIATAKYLFGCVSHYANTIKGKCRLSSFTGALFQA